MNWHKINNYFLLLRELNLELILKLNKNFLLVYQFPPCLLIL